MYVVTVSVTNCCDAMSVSSRRDMMNILLRWGGVSKYADMGVLQMVLMWSCWKRNVVCY